LIFIFSNIWKIQFNKDEFVDDSTSIQNTPSLSATLFYYEAKRIWEEVSICII
jgi:hypothetical protein